MSAENTSSESLYQPWTQRNGFADWVIALFWIIGAFILFQTTASIVALGLVINKVGLSANPAEMMGRMNENLDLLFIGNSTGQILFLGLATWFITRLHSSKANRANFLRLKSHGDTLQKVAIGAVLIVVVQPVIWFLSWLNAMIPMPEFFSNMQNTQMQMIESYLKGDHLMILTLFHVALVPAICEETLYRGYVMRAFEKSWSIWPAIIVSGLLFGMYHIQLSNLLPLASIGMLLAYITWISESIYPAIVAHLINNGGSVLMGTYYPESAFAEMTPESMPPMMVVIPSLVISAYLVYWLYNQHSNKHTQEV